jgi:hypothetical protein
MAGLGPAIHVFPAVQFKTWMPGTRPGMTNQRASAPTVADAYSAGLAAALAASLALAAAAFFSTHRTDQIEPS